jgi:hypothetical protein
MGACKCSGNRRTILVDVGPLTIGNTKGLEKQRLMNVVSHDVNGTQIAEMQSKGIIIRSARDAADVIKQLLERGIKKLILHEKNLCPEMWQVSNGLAEAILKEFNNSGVNIALVGEFDIYKSKSLQELIQKHNLGKQAVFVGNVETAKIQLSKE